MSVVYTVTVTPAEPLLGQSLTATLRGRANGATTGALTFGHGSLVLTLRHAEEPEGIFLPNVSAVQAPGKLLRLQAAGGKEDLEDGAELEREFALLDHFPALLGVGRFAFSFRIEADASAEPAEPAEFRIRAAPGCVPHLVRLASEEGGEHRERAAELLRKISGQVYLTPEETGRWWLRYGTDLGWDDVEGELKLPSLPMSERQKRELLGAFAAPESLQGELEAPEDPFIYEPDSEVTEALAGAIGKTTEAGAETLCRFVAKYPERALAEPLRKLGPVAEPLLDRLEAGRVRMTV